MATMPGIDRNGRMTQLTDTWPELLPITAREVELLKAVRFIEDLTVLNEPLDPEDIERIELARGVATTLIKDW